MGLKVRFWGVRGSIACPGPDTVVYGGNTLCIELRLLPQNRLIIVDAGSGIRTLGDHLVRTDLKKGPINADIFITHTHWDHIMGFPFFTPNFIKGTKLNIYGPVSYEEDTLDKIIGDLLRYRYFPVRHSELAADIEYHQLKECQLDLGDGLTVRTKYLNHPILCLGYRFEYKGKVVCTAFDTEPFRNVFTTDPDALDYDQVAAEQGQMAVQKETEKLIDFYQDADLLIHDAQYTRQEYLDSRIGWGHTSFEDAIDFSRKARVKHLVLYHHDPNRTDQELQNLEKHYRGQFANSAVPKLTVAKEVLEIDL